MPRTVSFTAALRREYAELFQTCRVRASTYDEVTTGAGRLARGKEHYAANTIVPLALESQQALHRGPGIQPKEDGRAGRRTSDAFKRVTSRRLSADPRGE